MALVFTDDNFDDEVLKSNVPVAVDFWAPWCKPCNMLTPVVESVSNNTDGFKVGKLNVDENRQSSQKWNVSAIPTIIFFKNGEEVDRHTGIISEDVLKSKLNSLK